MSSFKQLFCENVLDPIRKELAKTIWENNKLLPKVKEFVVNNFYDWAKKQNIDLKKIKKIYILGSITGYQFNRQSDIDTNIVIDLPKEKLDDLWKILPNGQVIPNTLHEVNYYLSNEFKNEWKKEKNGIWDIFENKWMKEPEDLDEVEPIKNYEMVVEIARVFYSGFDVMFSEYKKDVDAYNMFSEYIKTIKDKQSNEYLELDNRLKIKLEEILSDINSIFIAKHVLHSFRGQAFEGKLMGLDIEMNVKNHNSSINNLIYKYLEKLGYYKTADEIIAQKEKWISIRDAWNK
jgi:Zn-finger protein